MKLNKYQKILLFFYCATFIYFAIIHVPFKMKQDSEIVYDTLFSNRANIDFSRLLLVIIISTLISGMLFLGVRNLQLTIKLKPSPKLKLSAYILIGIIIVSISAFLLIQKTDNSFTLKQGSNKMDSTSIIVKQTKKTQTSLPIFDTTSQINLPPFLRNKYLYDGKIFDFSEIFHAAKKSNLEIDAYIKKAGIIVVDEEGLPIPSTILKKYKIPNGKIVDGSILFKKYGKRFYKLVDNGTFKEYNEKE